MAGVEKKRISLSELRGYNRVKKVDVIDTILSGELEIYMVLSKHEKPFLENPMMWMHRQGKNVLDKFDILAFHSLLLKEYTPDEYMDNISEIAHNLNVIHSWLALSITEEIEVDGTDMTAYRIVPNEDLFKRDHKIISKIVTNLFVTRRKDVFGNQTV